MEQWLESVYSDGTSCFVSKPKPKLFDTKEAPVRHVFLRTVPNGAEKLIRQKKSKRNG